MPGPVVAALGLLGDQATATFCPPRPQVGTNGIISTQDFPRETQYVDDGFPTDFPAIAPFLADIDTSQGRGRILYREDTSPEVLDLAARYVRTSFPRTASDFTPTHAFLATWEQVGAYQEPRLGMPPSGEVRDKGCLAAQPVDGMGLNSRLEPRERLGVISESALERIPMDPLVAPGLKWLGYDIFRLPLRF